VTVADAVQAVSSWSEPPGIAPRGTVLVVPGRGEQPDLYERFGRRIAADGYRVLAVADPTVDAGRTRQQVEAAVAADGPRPFVLAGSDSGALFAVGLARDLPVDGLVLAGLPVAPDDVLDGAPDAADDFDDEVQARTACPTHQGRLAADGAVRHGALREPVPAAWFDAADPAALAVPVLGLHGGDDRVSAIAAARDWYARVPLARLVVVTGGRHDALNDQTHRSAAAETVLFLERLRLGPDLPVIARVALGVNR
jgi:alpha-beta hydrolase superfamily lysophospholipase